MYGFNWVEISASSSNTHQEVEKLMKTPQCKTTVGELLHGQLAKEVNIYIIHII